MNHNKYILSLTTLALAFCMALPVGAGEEKREEKGLPFEAEYLPPDGWQNVQWQDPGHWKTIDMTQHGCKPNDETIDAAAKVREILAKNKQGNLLLYFPAGVFYLNSDLEIRRDNVRIAGAGHDKTTLLINTKSEDNGEVAFIGGETGKPVKVIGTHKRGDKSIQVASVEGLEKGDFVQLSNKDPKAWGIPEQSQIFRILSVSGGTLELDMKLGIDFSYYPSIRKLELVENVGIEKVHVRRVRAAKGEITANINFERAFNGFARDCESSKLVRGGVAANCSRNIVVERCFIHHAFGYGGGGQAYGILFNCGATNCRATNNKLWYLRHHIQLAIGANHCVISYNSCEPTCPGGFDCHIHGFFVHNSLFEGNTGSQLGSDSRGSSSGKYVAFYRNRFDTVYSTTKKGASHFLFAGNIARKEDHINTRKIQHVAQVENSWDENDSKPTETRLPPSLYLKEQPAFLEGLSWPVFGPGAKEGDQILPAKSRAKPSDQHSK